MKYSELMFSKGLLSYDIELEQLISEIMVITNINTVEAKEELTYKIRNIKSALSLQMARKIRRLVLTGISLNEAIKLSE